ncbi:MAG: aldehyde dehydrogenase family protein [Phycisphaerales bacterium]|nr:aldehyde dehydrogenase family protein [Phycisphaerales bacterium]
MNERLPVTKTYKLFIGGKLPRSESGRSTVTKAPDGQVFAHTCRASRKDLRDAVEAARKALPGWRSATPYLRGQILYRMAEMLEGKRAEFIESLRAVDGRAEPDAAAEVNTSIDRLVCFAGWADKHQQVFGCANPVAGPYHNFTIAEPVGVSAIVVSSPSRPLLGLVSLVAPALASASAVVAVSDETNPIPACVLGEVVATSDVPGGVVNILTGTHDELVPHIASHAGIDAVLSAGLSPAHRATLLEGAGANLKRVHAIENPGDFADELRFEGPSALEPFLEFKTLWHPSAT